MYFCRYFRHLNAFVFLYQKMRTTLYDLVFSMFLTCKTNRTSNCFTRKKYFFNSNNVEKQLSIYFFQTFTIPLSWIFIFLQIIKISKKNIFICAILTEVFSSNNPYIISRIRKWQKLSSVNACSVERGK